MAAEAVFELGPVERRLLQFLVGLGERFDLERDGRTIPGLLWTPPDATGTRPLVLIGHGASGSKREEYVTAFGRRLVRHLGYAAAAIDGPVHGDRRANRGSGPDMPFFDFGQLWSSDETMTDVMVADWKAATDALQAEPDIGRGPLGYWGLSMGTILGLPLVAAEPRTSRDSGRRALGFRLCPGRTSRRPSLHRC